MKTQAVIAEREKERETLEKNQMKNIELKITVIKIKTGKKEINDPRINRNDPIWRTQRKKNGLKKDDQSLRDLIDSIKLTNITEVEEKETENERKNIF